MKKTVILPLAALICGGLIGYSIKHWSDDTQRASKTGFSPIVARPAIARITEQEARQHRESHFQSLTTIADILSLPSDFDQTEALYALAGRSDVTALEQLIEDALSLTHNQNRRAAVHILLSRYTELAPMKALDLLNQLPADEANRLIQVVYHHWARMDVNGALTAALNEPDRQRQQQAARAIFQAWQDEDPQVLEQIRRRFAGRVDFSHLQMELLATRATHSPRASIEEALQLTDQNMRWQAVSRIATAWAQRSPLDAYEFAMGIDNQVLREAALNSIISTWAQTPQGAAAAFDRITESGYSSQRQSIYLTTVLNQLAANDPEQALEMADQLPASIRQQAYQTILQSWARTDVRAAVAMFEQLPNSPMRQQIQYSLVYEYTRQHPEEALQWASQASGNNRQQLLSMVLTQMAGNDPQLALNSALSVKDPIQSAQLLSAILGTVASNNPQLAADHISELPAGQFRQQALRTIASQWMGRDPDAALDWVATLDENAYRATMQQIGRQLSYQDPERAAALLPQFSDAMRQQWTPHIAGAMARTDPQQAADWIRQFSSDRNYPQLMQQVATAWGQQDPLAALDFISELPGNQRLNSMNAIVSSWANTDLQAAASWVSNNASSDEQQVTARSIAWQWASRDFDGARQWVNSLSDKARDAALTQMIGMGNLPQQQGLELVSDIKDKAMRSQAITNLFYRQLNQDRSAAQELLNHPDLDPNHKKNLEATLESGNNSRHRIVLPGNVIQFREGLR